MKGSKPFKAATCPPNSNICLAVDDFGEICDGKGSKKVVKRFTWKSSSKVEVQLINYGACITSIKTPDKNLEVRDIVLGFNTLEEYLKPDNPYFGCTVGRVANRIAKGQMKINDQDYKLAINNGPNHLHGGLKGFDKVIWDYDVVDDKVTLSYLSPDMEEGYPGDLLVNITFELNCQNEFVINYKAMTTKTTVVNLTNHSYFNLAGDDAGACELYNHAIYINAKKVTEVDCDLIPTGNLLPVKGTVYDFSESLELGEAIRNSPVNGYDDNFCLDECNDIRIAAKALHHNSGRLLEVYTDQPGIQFYTGNFLPEDESLKIKKGYAKKHGAFCFETQNYPDAINQPKFPSPLLHPGEVYNTTTIFKFLIEEC